MYFEILGEITEITRIAAGRNPRAKASPQTIWPGALAKTEGCTKVRLPGGRIRTVELHWYEAHGICKRKIKIKRYLD